MLYKNLKIKFPNLRVATGLYSNIDSIIKVDEKVLKELKKFRKSKPKKITLDSMEQISYALNSAIKRGGSEFLISEKVYKKLISIFPEREIRVGGNGNLMGQTLSMFGLDTLVSYPLRPEKLMKMSGNVKVADGGKLKSPKDSIRKDDPLFEHIIFEFKNDRLILTYDPMSTHGFFDHQFLEFATNSKFIDILILGYAHLLLPEYKQRTEVTIDYLKMGERPKIHLEFGTGSKESMKYAIERLSGYCDSFGMNEEECKIYLGAKSENRNHLIQAALKAVKSHGLERICIHGKKFVFSVSKNSFEKESEALATASLIASAKTFGEMDIEKARNLPVSAKPLQKKMGKYNLCLVPCLLNPEPKVLTGIGDAFASIQAVKSLY